MTAIDMGDVNTRYAECAYRRHLLAARALNERSLLIRGRSIPRTETIGEVYIDNHVILSVLLLSDVHVDSSPIEVQRADAVFDFLQMPTNAGNSSSTLTKEFWRGRLVAFQAHSGSLLTAEFRSCSCKSAALAAPPRRVGIHPRLSARGVRQSRRVLHEQPPRCLQRTELCLMSFFCLSAP